MTEGRLPPRTWRVFFACWVALAVLSVVVAAVTWIDDGGPWWINLIFTGVAAFLVVSVWVWWRVPHD